MTVPRADLLQGDALHLPLPDASVDLVVTSPPYFGLRSYRDRVECDRCRQLRDGWGRRDDHDRNLREAWPDYDAHVASEHKPTHYPGQIGAEATPQEFLDALLAATREMARVLKPSGSIFLNLGDRYVGGGGQWEGDERPDPGRRRAVSGKVGTGGKTYGMPRKSLMLLPERYRIRAVDELGLIARAVVIWGKANPLPESVTDRVRRSHEDWVHLTKQPRYFSAVDEIREAYDGKTAARYASGCHFGANQRVATGQHNNGAFRSMGAGDTGPSATNPLGKLPGSVWEIPTQPLTIPDRISHARCCGGRKRDGCQDGLDHNAAFPMEWPRRLIQGWSPSGVCVECGEGRRPVAVVGESSWQRRRADGDPTRYGLLGNSAPLHRSLSDPADRAAGGFGVPAARRLIGYACACPEPTAPTRPSVVLDPFGGTGTTALVASMLGRIGVSVDMSADYCRLARWRTTDPGQRAAAMQVAKPPPVPDGQEAMFP